MSLADNLVIQKFEKGSRGSTIVDLILTNRGEMVEGVNIVGTLGQNDHVILEFITMETQVTEQSQTSALDFNRVDFSKLIERLERNPWMEILEQ